jgi:hypothetical protein
MAAWDPTVPGARLFQLLVTTPVALAAGFASTAAFVVIALCDLLVVGVGLALVREPVAAEPLPATQSS